MSHRVIDDQSDGAIGSPGVDNSSTAFVLAVQTDRTLNVLAKGYALVWASGIWASTVAGDRVEIQIDDGNGNVVSTSAIRDICSQANRNQPWALIASIPRNLSGPPPATVHPKVQFRRLAGTGTVTVSRAQITCIEVSPGQELIEAAFGMIFTRGGVAFQALLAGIRQTLALWASNGPSLDTTPDATTNRITVASAGTYAVGCQLSITSSANNINSTSCITINGADSNLCFKRKISTGADIGSGGMTGILVLAAGDKVGVSTLSDTDTNLTLVEGQLAVNRVS